MYWRILNKILFQLDSPLRNVIWFICARKPVTARLMANFIAISFYNIVDQPMIFAAQWIPKMHFLKYHGVMIFTYYSKSFIFTLVMRIIFKVSSMILNLWICLFMICFRSTQMNAEGVLATMVVNSVFRCMKLCPYLDILWNASVHTQWNRITNRLDFMQAAVFIFCKLLLWKYI